MAASVADAVGFVASDAGGFDLAASGTEAEGLAASEGFTASGAGIAGLAASGTEAGGFATSVAGEAGFAARDAGADGAVVTTELAAGGAGTAARGTACCVNTVPDTAFGTTAITGLLGRKATYPATAATRNNTTSPAMTQTNGDRLGARHGSYLA